MGRLRTFAEALALGAYNVRHRLLDWRDRRPVVDHEIARLNQEDAYFRESWRAQRRRAQREQGLLRKLFDNRRLRK